MFCPNDGIENREGAKRCKKCGSCLNCGENDPGEKSCKKCRIPLTDTAPSQCPKGHSLTPGNTRCDICEATASHAVPASAPALSGARRREPTEIDASDVVQSHRGPTGADTVETRAQNRPQRRPTQFGNARKIVGILVTYSWKKEGEVFEIREGRNIIGSDIDCDVHVSYDPSLSG